MKRSWMLALVLMTGCAWTQIEAGKPLSKLTKGIEWCSTKRLEVQTNIENVTEPGPLPPSLFAQCTPLIQTRLGDEDFRGTAAFGLSTNAWGSITSVCVWGANYEHGEEYVECVGKAIAASGYRLEPNQDKGIYRVTFVYE